MQYLLSPPPPQPRKAVQSTRVSPDCRPDLSHPSHPSHPTSLIRLTAMSPGHQATPTPTPRAHRLADPSPTASMSPANCVSPAAPVCLSRPPVQTTAATTLVTRQPASFSSAAQWRVTTMGCRRGHYAGRGLHCGCPAGWSAMTRHGGTGLGRHRRRGGCCCSKWALLRRWPWQSRRSGQPQMSSAPPAAKTAAAPPRRPAPRYQWLLETHTLRLDLTPHCCSAV